MPERTELSLRQAAHEVTGCHIEFEQRALWGGIAENSPRMRIIGDAGEKTDRLFPEHFPGRRVEYPDIRRARPVHDDHVGILGVDEVAHIGELRRRPAGAPEHASSLIDDGMSGKVLHKLPPHEIRDPGSIVYYTARSHTMPVRTAGDIKSFACGTSTGQV